MKKSTFWIIVAVISIIFAVHSVMNMNIIQAMIGCATCCSSLVVGAWYERKELDSKNI
jgi:hypothetical protein